MKIENFKREDYGAFLQYVDDLNVTDIEWNGYMLLITDLVKGKYRVMEHEVTPIFLEQFTNMIANTVNLQFNPANANLEAETPDFRITMIHDSLAVTGVVVILRRITAIRRLDTENLIESKYCPPEILSFLINCVKTKFNFVICGSPGVGKTEFLKYLTLFVNEYDRVFTVEDTLELHYKEINPEKDGIALKVNESYSYSDAIKKALRSSVRWLMITEVRDQAVDDLFEAYTTGINGMTTIHVDDVRKLVDRIAHMSANANVMNEKAFTDMVYTWVDIVMLIKRRPAKKGEGDKYREEKAPRYLDQLCIYARNEEKGENKCYMLMENGKVINPGEIEIPDYIVKRMQDKDIKHPFACNEVENVLEERKVEEKKAV